MDLLQQRITHIREYLKSISGDDSMTSIVEDLESASSLNEKNEELQSAMPSADDFELGVLIGQSDNGRGLETLHSLYTNNDEQIDLEGLYELEAIIHKVGRPAIDVIHDTYSAPANGSWSKILAGDSKLRINHAIKSVGRIEVSNVAVPYAGTGFVVGEDILMTNRHVARVFASGIGAKNLLFDSSMSPGIDFKREIIPPLGDPEILRIEDVLMIHPYFDLALLKVKGLDMSVRLPLGLSTKSPEDLHDNNIVVVGYPAKDRRNNMVVQWNVFNNRFEVKRLSPGKFKGRIEYEAKKNTIIRSIAHDSSTLGV